jgi:hypothetical protein
MANEVPARLGNHRGLWDPWSEEAKRRLDAGEMIPTRTEDGQVQEAHCTCGRMAGAGTSHTGIGRCRMCGGRSLKEERVTRLMERHAFTRGMRITPSNALLTQVHLSHSRVEHINERLTQLLGRTITEDGTPDPDALVSDPLIRRWLDLQREERELLLRFAKLAYDAGADELRTDYGTLFTEAVTVFLGRIGVTDPAQVTATIRELGEILTQLEEKGVGQLPPA